MRWTHPALDCDDTRGDDGLRFERAASRRRAVWRVLFHLERAGGEEGAGADFTASQGRAGRQDAPSAHDEDKSLMRRQTSCATGVKGVGRSTGRKRMTAVHSQKIRRRAPRGDRRRLRALGMTSVTVRKVAAG